ncbi:MAG TPA: LuxR C-terminal-related transcriptional regulator [Jatrophihabitans sp.]|nr:LuxR C-terminal-related transcriptional regulator [Jatrophihabitans sp.]
MRETGSPKISPREAEVLRALGEHLTNAEIAARLVLSVRTVENHVSSLLRKLGAADRRELAAMASLEASIPPDRAPIVGLPIVWTSFVGRDGERAQVLAALDEARLVTLTGPGGTGKTRLAAEVSAEHAASSRHGATWVDLVPVRESGLLRAVAAAVGVTEQPERTLADVIYEELARRGPHLLVLDNCEQLTSTVARLVLRLLGACPDTTVLATSRERLGVPGEQLIQVPPLSLTDGGGAPEATRLFLERAALRDADADRVAEICRRVDALPLAIELAAARVPSLGVDGVLVALQDSFRFLTEHGREERHRSLGAVLDWSFALLDEAEQQMLRRLGIFAGSFDLPAAAAVTDEVDQASTADLLGRLADKSLVEHTRTAAGSRWRLLDTVRRYAREQSESAGETSDTAARHVRWAAEAAAGLERRLDTDETWRTEFALLVDDLTFALAQTSGAGPDGSAHRLARSLGHLLYASRFFRIAEQRFRDAAQRAPTAADAMTDLREAAYVATADVRGDTAVALLRAAADQAVIAGDESACACCLSHVVSMMHRIPSTMDKVPSREQLDVMLAEALLHAARAADPIADAYVAQAVAWNAPHEAPDVGLELAERAFTTAVHADVPALVSGALDAQASRLLAMGRFRDAHATTLRRVPLLDRMPQHDPRNATELIDTVHMVIDAGVSVGALSESIAAVRRFQGNDLLSAWVHYSGSKSIVPLVLAGRFDQALDLAAPVWGGWLRAGRPPARWLAPTAVAVSLLYGLRSDSAACTEWRERAFAFAGTRDLSERNNVAGLWVFAQLRQAVHAGDVEAVSDLVDGVLARMPRWRDTPGFYDAYVWAAAVEVGVLARRSDASRLLCAAHGAAEENDWAAACLKRVRGRLTDDQADFAEAVLGFERIGAQFERACTLMHIPERAKQGRAELKRLGCAPPAQFLNSAL